MAMRSKCRWGDWKTSRYRRYLLVFFSPCLLVFILTTACAPIRPIYKIGLLAPFEGLSRRNGYEALAAMHAAIGDAAPQGIDLLPLALDDSADPVRAAQKMLADPTLKAVVGPLTIEGVEATRALFGNTDLPRFAPFAVAPAGGFADPTQNSDWVTGLIQTIARTVQKDGKTQLFLAGWIDGLPDYSEQEWTELINIDIKLLSSFERIDGKILNQELLRENFFTRSSAIVWLGSAEQGARFASELWKINPEITIWTGAQGGDPIFGERLEERGALYWATWSNPGYEQWAATHQPASPATYLVYLATRAAIVSIQTPNREVAEMPWAVRCFRVDDANANIPVQCG